MQNTKYIQKKPHTAGILMTRCSRRQKEQVIENYGFKKKLDPFRTCKRCRTQPNIVINRSGSFNDHLNVIQEIENPIIEDTLIGDELKKDIPKIENSEEIFINDDTDSLCISKTSRYI